MHYQVQEMLRARRGSSSAEGIAEELELQPADSGRPNSEATLLIEYPDVAERSGTASCGGFEATRLLVAVRASLRACRRGPGAGE